MTVLTCMKKNHGQLQYTVFHNNVQNIFIYLHFSAALSLEADKRILY